MANHQEVAHSWAHKHTRNTKGFNMYHDGETIYSYGSHFPIARWAEDADGNEVLLMTSRSYSISTSMHIGYVRQAVYGGTVPRFSVYNPDAGKYCYAKSARAKREHKENYKHMLSEREDLLLKASRARGRKDEYLGDAERLREQANAYSKAFRLGFRSVEAPADLQQELDAMAERAKREAAALKRKREREQAERDARDRENLKEWLDGGDVRPPHTRIPYVRVRNDTVQTTWGVTVPLRRALALYRLAKHCARCGHEYQPRKRQLIDGFPIDKIASDGTIRAGCHVIPLRVQQEAARLAGLERVTL